MNGYLKILKLNFICGLKHIREIHEIKTVIDANKHVIESPSTADLYDCVNKLVADNFTSRLFAVVHIAGKQFKVTTGDLIKINGTFYPTLGDEIFLEKVLLVGGRDFTVVGKPLIPTSFVKVRAAVIEKTLSPVIISYTYKPRKSNERMILNRIVHTLLRIVSIELNGSVPSTVSEDRIN